MRHARHAGLLEPVARGLLAAVVFAAGIALTPPARAEDARPVLLKVRAKSCTTEAAFWDELARRTPLVRRAVPGERAAVVDIEIVGEGRRSVGRLKIISERAPRSRRLSMRKVRGDSCEEIVATLSLMTAMAFDPAAISAPPPTGATSTEEAI